MADDERDERVKRFNFLVARAARVMNVPVDHQRAVVQAGLDFVYETVLNHAIDRGQLPGELSAFIRLSELELESAPPPPLPEVTLTIVRTTIEAKPSPSAETTPADNANAPTSSTANVEPVPAAAAAPLPPAKPPLPLRRGISPSEFHDQAIPNADGSFSVAPLARSQNMPSASDVAPEGTYADAGSFSRAAVLAPLWPKADRR
jgi:hypothetical protein